MSEKPFIVTGVAEHVETRRTWALRSERPIEWTVNAQRGETDCIVPLRVTSIFRDGGLVSVTVYGLAADYTTNTERTYRNEDEAPVWLWTFCGLDRNPQAGQ